MCLSRWGLGPAARRRTTIRSGGEDVAGRVGDAARASRPSARGYCLLPNPTVTAGGGGADRPATAEGANGHASAIRASCGLRAGPS